MGFGRSNCVLSLFVITLGSWSVISLISVGITLGGTAITIYVVTGSLIRLLLLLIVHRQVEFKGFLSSLSSRGSLTWLLLQVLSVLHQILLARSDNEYLYKYDPKEKRVIISTTIVRETRKARRALEIKADTNLKTETRLVAGIKTLLDTISITLRTKRESN